MEKEKRSQFFDWIEKREKVRGLLFREGDKDISM